MQDSGGASSDDQRERLFQARGTARGMQAIAALLLLNAAIGPLSFYATTGALRLSPALLGGAIGVAVLALVHRGWIGTAMRVFIWGGTLIPLWGLYRGYGLLDGNLLFLPVAAMGAGFMLGTRHAVAVSVVAAAAVGGLLWRELTGQGFAPPPMDTRIPHAISAIFAVVLGAIVGARSTRAYRDQYEQTLALSRGLEASVQARTAELNEALRNLTRAQDELVESGTLASLGAMVAGVSHELNTPIGNALMASTTVHADLEALEQRMAAGQLTRSEFAASLAHAVEASRLCTASIERAAELVASFKQVAVDRASERRRGFDLGELVEDTLATLRPGLKTQPWVLRAEVPRDVRMDSFPGPLGQVLTNLVQNALVHGFEGRAEGTVTVTASEDGDDVHLVVVDDGIGMAPDTLAQIFDPFFTTRLGRGGSGLGLSICHRIVARVLGGELSARSRLGEGSRFEIRLPKVAPADHGGVREVRRR